MTVREQVKAEIDKVGDQYLLVLFRMIRSLETPALRDEAEGAWSQFLAATFGCLAEAPIERGDQGAYEIRDSLQ